MMQSDQRSNIIFLPTPYEWLLCVVIFGGCMAQYQCGLAVVLNIPSTHSHMYMHARASWPAS
eukprot:6192183-Pleurochrysis_carterae.AAC.2